MLRKMIHCVRWVWCPRCKKCVDEFETKCGWCGCVEGARQLESRDD